MPTHWTYDGFRAEDDLEQGDILRPTSSLRAVFDEVHPHFSNDKYLGFVVVTQSCDLVRRRGAPKASYVSLAVIRPLVQVANQIFSAVAEPLVDLPATFRLSKKVEAKRLVQRIVNQNEQGLGLFYLHQDADSGIGENSVVFLRVTVSLRADHYGKLVEARAGRLATEYRAKFGWLVGNLYNRPATRDWADFPDGDRKFKKLIDEHTSEQVPGHGPVWIDDELVQEATKRGLDLATITPEELASLRPPSNLEKALDEVGVAIRRVSSSIGDDEIDKIKNRLRNNGKYVGLFEKSANTDTST